jgi:hypothetical protein
LKTSLHVFVFFAAFFNVRQSSALVSTVFMLLASTAKAKSDTIDRTHTHTHTHARTIAHAPPHTLLTLLNAQARQRG